MGEGVQVRSLYSLLSDELQWLVMPLVKMERDDQGCIFIKEIKVSLFSSFYGCPCFAKSILVGQ